MSRADCPCGIARADCAYHPETSVVVGVDQGGTDEILVGVYIPHDVSDEQLAKFQKAWDEMLGARVLDRNELLFAHRAERILPAKEPKR